MAERAQMSKSEKNLTTITGYILGSIPDKDRIALAERFFENDELFDLLLTAENDLLDSYVRNRLSPQDNNRFERYLAQLPDAKEKLALARSLARMIRDHHGTAAVAERSSEPPSAWCDLVPAVHWRPPR